jgi:hypothetical protein
VKQRVRLTLPGFSDSAQIEDGRPLLTEDEVRVARLNAARRNPAWREIDEPVERAPWLVDAASDRVFRRHRGDVWTPGAASTLTPDLELTFYVDADETVRFVERVSGVTTYTELLGRRARQEREREQPPPPMRIRQ